MSGISIKMEGHCFNTIKEIALAIKSETNAELVCENYHHIDFVNVGVLAFEKYFFRNGSYASLMVVLTENGDEKTADIIGSGGGEGLFNISWGANAEMAEKTERILSRYGFRTMAKGRR